MKRYIEFCQTDVLLPNHRILSNRQIIHQTDKLERVINLKIYFAENKNDKTTLFFCSN